MDILINSPIVTSWVDTGDFLVTYVFFFFLAGGRAGSIATITVQELNAGLGSVALTDRLPAARTSTPQHSRCPLTTLSRAVGLISHSSLIAWNQTLKEGGSHYMSLLVKSEKYGRQTEIKSERQRNQNKNKSWFQKL